VISRNTTTTTPGPSRGDEILSRSVDNAAEQTAAIEARRAREWRPFPTDILPEPVRSYVCKGARAIGCDESFIALPSLSALASAIGNTRRLQLKRGSWTEPSILWTAIVGESGTGKSPALELALRSVRKRQRRSMIEHTEQMKAHEAEVARWEVEKAAWKKDGAEGDPPEAPERPVCARTWCDDVTTEALVMKLQENPRGLLMARNELSAWFDFDRYSGGRGGGDAAKWIEVYDGRALIVDRKTSDTEYVPHASVSIAGGIQPAILQRCITERNRENGLLARLLFAMPPRRAKRWTEADLDELTESAVDSVFDALYALEPDLDDDDEPTPRLVRLSPGAKRAWIAFVNQHGAETFALVGDEAAAWSKLEAVAARVALVMHLVRVAAGVERGMAPDTLDEASVAVGIEFAEWAGHEARRVYSFFDETDEQRERRELIEWIKSKGGSVTARDLSRGPRRYRRTGDAEAALDALVAVGRGSWRWPPSSDAGGRPTKLFNLNRGDSGDGDETTDDGATTRGSVTVATSPEIVARIPADPEGGS